MMFMSESCGLLIRNCTNPRRDFATLRLKRHPHAREWPATGLTGICSFQRWRSITRSPARPNVPSESSTSLVSRLSWARRMQSGLWQYSNTPSRLRNQRSRAKMNSAQNGRVWRFAPGRFSMRPEEHTRNAHGWSHRLKIVRWHRDKIVTLPPLKLVTVRRYASNATALEHSAPSLQSGFNSVRSGRRDQACNRLHIVAAGEHIGCERAVIRPKVILQQSFEHGAHIGGGLEVAVLQQVLRLEPRPVGDHAAAFERAAGEQHDGGGAVVGAIRTVDARRAAEFGDGGLAPRRSHVFLDGGESRIER